LAHPDQLAPPEPTTQPLAPPELETQSPAPIAPPELNLNEDEIDLLQMIQLALAQTDPEEGRQAALDIQPILKLTCANGCADKKKIWDALTENEQANFKALLAPSLEQQPVPEPLDPAGLEPVPPQEAGEPQPAQITTPES
jgi:hypothetical protein